VTRFAPAVLVAITWLCSASCEIGGDRITLPALTARVNDAGVPVFTCLTRDTRACSGTILQSCKPVGEFLQSYDVDCAKKGGICDPVRGCITCSPRSRRCQACAVDDEKCDRNVVQECNADGSAWEDVQRCDLTMGDACYDGRCENMCRQATTDRSYVGCIFYAADLDNAAIDDLDNASAQQFAVAVANPQSVVIEVEVEINDGLPGAAPELKVIDSVMVAPGALEVFELPRREVDGSTQDGLNDGTHTALTSRAFRVTSSHPMIAYQFNPLENSNVFSNDASLLLPTSAIDRDYTVIGWPQTIGTSENPEQDFDPTSGKEDLRAFLTIIGTATGTGVDIELGSKVVKVVGAGQLPESGPGDMLHVELEPFDVLNLETEGFNADFTGTLVNATEPVTVFTGSEASDVPMFGTLATRQCCADHLEEQLIPDATLGSFYSIARMPARTKALAASAFPDEPLNIAQVNEPEWVRVIATAEGLTKITTTLPPPNDSFELSRGAVATLRADQDFLLDSNGRPVAVLQALASQGVTGIPGDYPGGDPDLIVVPPIQQYRRDYVFLTPDKYAFDFVTIMAERTANVLLDGKPLPDTCTTSSADGVEREPGEAEPDRVIHRCQLSFPRVTRAPNSKVLPGDQDDGVHTIVADRDVGIIVYGFDKFVSYAYVGGLNLDVIN
jgi:hypothetical protein